MILNLVGGFNPSEKYEFVNGKDDIPYMKWKITAMFETTNQLQGKPHRKVQPEDRLKLIGAGTVGTFRAGLPWSWENL